MLILHLVVTSQPCDIDSDDPQRACLDFFLFLNKKNSLMEASKILQLFTKKGVLMGKSRVLFRKWFFQWVMLNYL